MKFRVYPYKQGSASAKKLAEALNGKVLRHVGSKFVPRPDDVVVNWGSAQVPAFKPARTLNSPESIALASNKLKSFDAMEKGQVQVPLFVRTIDEARGLQFPVVCRTVLQGHSGAGIVIATKKEELVNAPLYTQYVKKQDEYRIHVMGTEPFFLQRKARKLENENPNWQVRNLAGGFVFVEVEEAAVPKSVLAESVKAIAALGLDFGGVDVIWNAQERKAYVLEVNTACGLEDRTADHYREAVQAYIAE